MMRDVKRFAMRVPLTRPRALILMGRYHAGVGKCGDAAACFRRGLAESTALGMPYEQGLAHAGLAGLRLSPRERDQHAGQATAIMRSLGVAANAACAADVGERL
jgi:hypothetical protein